ncbi:hypothetical protein O9K51_04088 [Purpureocillium lavendulum]|uniref:Uncharacterized protein n=1 Tax=Purpureocillium lavendulum TaxID=1247861 RepID=A0AB34FVE7_9HYPO|nr:hypothetical protein O9K51_04088 [Purpureocillium lavendulum]
MSRVPYTLVVAAAGAAAMRSIYEFEDAFRPIADNCAHCHDDGYGGICKHRVRHGWDNGVHWTDGQEDTATAGKGGHHARRSANSKWYWKVSDCWHGSVCPRDGHICVVDYNQDEEVICDFVGFT